MKKVITLLLVLAGAAAAFALMQGKQQATAPALPRLASIHDFELIDQQGQPFKSEQLKGKVWIASFIFTRCQGPCPMMSQKMARLQEELSALANVRHISISIDPEHDSPEVLKAYSEKYKAQPGRWYFLTGDKQEIIRIAREAFKLPAGEDPNLHSTRFVLVDADANIRGYYDSTDAESMKRLREHVQALGTSPSA